MQMELNPEQKLVIFLHISKTGGTTMNGILHQQYRRDTIFNVSRINFPHQFDELPTIPQEKVLFKGHMLFGLHNYLPSPATYFTILRHPIERMISSYNYLRGNPDFKTLAKTIDMKSFFQSILKEGKLGLLTNRQTKIVSGHGLVNCSDERALIEKAKENFDKHFAVVGLTKRFDETLVLLNNAFGWKNPVYVRQNVSKKTSEMKTLDGETLKFLEYFNQLDIELYEYARTKFE